MNLLSLWFQMTVPGYAPEVTRDQLGKLPAGPQAAPFKPPPPNSALQPEPWWYRL